MGRIRQTKFSGNDYWTDVLLRNEEEEVAAPPSRPTVTTTSVAFNLSNPSAFATGNISDAGFTDSGFEYGFVWSFDNNPPTLSDTVVTVGSEPFTGSYNHTISISPFQTAYVAAYATNGAGTSYGATFTGETGLCLAQGTLITTATGKKKKIEEITYDDLLLVWDFDNSKFDKAKPIWMVKPFKAGRCGLVQFSNGAELKTIADGKGHRIFNLGDGTFTHMLCGDVVKTVTERKETIEVTSRKLIEQETWFYNIITDRHINLFANGILTSTGLNNLYPIESMKFVKDQRGLRDRKEFAAIETGLIEGLRLLEQPLSYPNLHDKLKRMVSAWQQR